MFLSQSILKLFHLKIIENWSTTLWVGLLILLTISALAHLPSSEDRRVFSDQSAHIAAAQSIWHDQDLVYTLTDLDRFRQALPAEPGPWGAYLKIGNNQHIYYAKPFLYALFSAPLVGLTGLAGFLLFNMLCIGVIGSLSIKILTPYLGSFNSLLLICGLIVFSPFLAWAPIAHPDIFIATLLMVGGYLLLRQDKLGDLSLTYIGAFVLGLSVYEKPTFAIIVLPLLITQILRIKPLPFFLIFLCVLIGWLIPTAVNLLQDGNILSYQGLRFYINHGTVGSFPLEINWKGPPSHGVTDKVFDVGALLKTLWGNIGLLPTKFLDLFIGRQTSLILYFPVSIILLGLLLLNFTWRTALVLSGFAAYLIINWIAFPTNGYGGAGTYGPRYTMQALPVLIVAFLVARNYKHGGRAFLSCDWKRYVAFSGLFISVALQSSVFPISGSLVRSPHQFLLSTVAGKFPLEDSLLPTIRYMLPSSFTEVTADQKNYIFKTHEDIAHCYNIAAGQKSSTSKILLFQQGPKKPIPTLILTATRDASVDFMTDNKVLASAYVKSNEKTLIEFDDIFINTFHDRHVGAIRWQELTIRTKLATDNNPSLPGSVRISFAEKPSIQSNYTIGQLLSPKEFENNGVEPLFCWQPDANNYWSSGHLAGLDFHLLENVDSALNLKIRLRPFFPDDKEPLLTDLYVNGQWVGHYAFKKNMRSTRTIQVLLPEELVTERRNMTILFHIHNPQQPNTMDYRYLGIAIKDILLTPDINQIIKPVINKTFYFKKSSSGTTLLGDGWNNPEGWGVWSDGEGSQITLPIGNIKEQIELHFDIQGYTPKESPFLEVDVYVNNIFQDKWNFQYGDSKELRSLDIAPNLIAKDHGVLNIDFRIHNPRSPKQLGRGKDNRLLGIGISRLHIKLLDTKNKQ